MSNIDHKTAILQYVELSTITSLRTSYFFAKL